MAFEVDGIRARSLRLLLGWIHILGGQLLYMSMRAVLPLRFLHIYFFVLTSTSSPLT